jgi:hypothetical protein
LGHFLRKMSSPGEPTPAPVRFIGIPLVGDAAPNVDCGGISQGVQGYPFSAGRGFVPRTSLKGFGKL